MDTKDYRQFSEQDDCKDVTIYVCGKHRDFNDALSFLIRKKVSVEGIKISSSDFLEEVKKDIVRSMMEMQVVVAVKSANFSSDRVIELLDREAEDSDSDAVLTRIHWGKNLQTDKIFPGKKYLVKICDKWYTGMFRMDPNNCWVFVDMDAQTIGTAAFRRSLQEENKNSSSNIQEIYEIVKL